MNFLLYYVLRRLFVKLRFSDKEISLEKGLLLKRLSVIPLSAARRITSRRTPFMRLFRAKEIEIFTLGGKIRFYLPKNERLPFLPETSDKHVIATPRFREIMLGAFIDTRALGGLFVFAAVLRRISAIFGSEYFDQIISVLSQTADELEKALSFMRVTVPKVAVTLAVFALGAWAFAYLRKLARLARFRVAKSGGMLFVESGVVTLYEHALVPNSDIGSECAVIRCDTLTTILARRAPLYVRGVMVCPSSRRGELPEKRLSSPKRAFFGHIAAPLVWLGIFTAALGAVHLSDYSAMLLKTVLYSGIIVNLYTAVLYLLYMYRAGAAFTGELAAVSARRGLRLYTTVFPRGAVSQRAVSQSVFQRRSGLCNFRVSLMEHKRFTVRQVPKSELPRHTPF